jgi:hypothetical protein
MIETREPDLYVTNEDYAGDPASGRQFAVRLVVKGDRYGHELKLTHTDDRPMVEFYDFKDAEKPFYIEANGGHSWGQFVSRYYADTLLSGDASGLDLFGGVPAWKVDAGAMAWVRSWLQEQVR